VTVKERLRAARDKAGRAALRAGVRWARKQPHSYEVLKDLGFPIIAIVRKEYAISDAEVKAKVDRLPDAEIALTEALADNASLQNRLNDAVAQVGLLTNAISTQADLERAREERMSAELVAAHAYREQRATWPRCPECGEPRRPPTPDDDDEPPPATE
jgi:hypothetical protein